MDDPRFVRGLQGFANLPDEGECPLQRERTFPLEESLEVGALDVVHGDKLEVARLAQVVDAEDVLVGHPARQEDLTLEALQHIRLRSHLGPDHFECHGAVQLAVACLVDCSHPALAEERQDLVAGSETRAGGEPDRGTAGA